MFDVAFRNRFYKKCKRHCEQINWAEQISFKNVFKMKTFKCRVKLKRKIAV